MVILRELNSDTSPSNFIEADAAMGAADASLIILRVLDDYAFSGINLKPLVHSRSPILLPPSLAKP